jgi:tetratricopeptide (TPR) repeat protein
MNRSLAAIALVILALLSAYTFVPRAAAESVAARTLEEADAAFRASDWPRAAEMYRALAEENPAQGAFWYLLATAQYNLKQYADAVTHYERSIAVGFRVGNCYYNVACCRALLGETRAAVDALDLAIRNNLRGREQYIREDTDLTTIRATPEFRERILPSVEGVSRTDGWRVDLEYLTRRVAETHYDPFRHITRKEWDAEIARISKAVPKMKDHEIAVALMQLVVRINDGHTGVFPPDEGPLTFHALPIDFYDFPDGIYVRAADARYADLVGKKLVRIGDTPAREVFERVGAMVPRDNPQTVRWLAARHLGMLEALNALGVTPAGDRAQVTVVDGSGRETTMEVVGLERADHRHGPRTADWKDMADDAPAPLPLWRRNKDKSYWFEFLAERRMVYVGFNTVRDQEDESLAAFAGRLFAFIDDNPVEALVIDVRTNNGGNNTLARSLMMHIVASEKINQRGRLFVITGRETFSACQNFCNWLDRDAAVLFVGEPTGSRPNFVGEGNEIILPYSGLLANASSRLWQDSFSEDRRVWIAPHISAEMTADDYRGNRDPAMEAIEAYRGTYAAASSR